MSVGRGKRLVAEFLKARRRSALFVDGPSLHYTAKALGFEIDFKRLLSEFKVRGALVRAYYYTMIVEDAGFQTIRPLIYWLDYNGFTVRAKPTKDFDDGAGRRKIKRNIAIELAVDALEIAKHVDHIILFSGDGDLRALIEAVQRKGIHVNKTADDCR